MKSQNNIADHLSEYVKSIHNQQHVLLSTELLQLLNFSQKESLTINLLTQQLNATLQDLPSNINKKTQYFQSQQFVIPPIVRKIGLISKQLSQLCNFNSHQEQFLAEFQTLKFMQLFPAQNKPKYNQQNLYQPLMIDFIKPIYPRMNVHKDNLPLYMPFYHRINSYQNQTPIGNPSWQLARRMFSKIYRQEMSLLNDQTRDGNTLEEQETSINKDAWFELLMCDLKYLKRYEQKGGINYIWAIMHFYYVQQTLKPYRNVRSNDLIEQKQSITLDVIILALRKRVVQENQFALNLICSFVLYQITQKVDDLVNVTRLVKTVLEGDLSALSENKITKQDTQLNFIALVNALSSQLLRNLIQTQSVKQMKDQNKIETLTTQMKQTIDLIDPCVSHRLFYHEFYLRIAYPSHQVDQKERTQNQQIILKILKRQLGKDTQTTTEIYPFPQYIYFEREFYEEFSKVYLKKHPKQIIEIAEFLPADIVVWRLLNSPNLSINSEFNKIRKILLNNKKRYLESIKQRVPQVTQNQYVSFVQSWDMYHQLFENQEVQLNQQDFNKFMKKLQQCKLTINFLYGMELPELFKQHVYFVLNKGENILKITQYMISGFEEVLQQVDNQTQKQIVTQYSQLMNNPKFQTKLLSGLTEQEKDQFWKKWTVVYLADQSLVKELVNGDQSEMEEDQQSDQISQEEQHIPIQSNKRPQKQTNQVIVMELEDD